MNRKLKWTDATDGGKCARESKWRLSGRNSARRCLAGFPDMLENRRRERCDLQSEAFPTKAHFMTPIPKAAGSYSERETARLCCCCCCCDCRDAAAVKATLLVGVCLLLLRVMVVVILLLLLLNPMLLLLFLLHPRTEVRLAVVKRRTGEEREKKGKVFSPLVRPYAAPFSKRPELCVCGFGRSPRRPTKRARRHWRKYYGINLLKEAYLPPNILGAFRHYYKTFTSSVRPDPLTCLLRGSGLFIFLPLILGPGRCVYAICHAENCNFPHN